MSKSKLNKPCKDCMFYDGSSPVCKNCMQKTSNGFRFRFFSLSLMKTGEIFYKVIRDRAIKARREEEATEKDPTDNYLKQRKEMAVGAVAILN